VFLGAYVHGIGLRARVCFVHGIGLRAWPRVFSWDVLWIVGKAYMLVS
jgi:hypothetical protein